MKKFIYIFKSLVLGITDSIMPKIENSIEKKESEFKNEPAKIEVNWIRFLATLLTFLFLILNFFKLITIEQIIEILKIIFQ